MVVLDGFGCRALLAFALWRLLRLDLDHDLWGVPLRTRRQTAYLTQCHHCFHDIEFDRFVDQSGRNFNSVLPVVRSDVLDSAE